MAHLTIIVLTKNEEANLPVLLNSANGLNAAFVIIDSGSSDGTVAVAEAAGCTVLHHAFENHAVQLNWAIDNAGITTPWVMRMDADERFEPELVDELSATLPALGPAVSGLLVKRQVWFWGRWIRHGGYYPTWLLRVWRNGRARCELRWMDEHMILHGGEVQRLRHDIIDENHKGLGFWTDKHNRYADREVRDILAADQVSNSAGRIAAEAGNTRWRKEKLYLRMPLFLRALLYWAYRYFLRLGFVDGRPGLVFHFLQAFWYRFLVDAKLYEARRRDIPPTKGGP